MSEILKIISLSKRYKHIIAIQDVSLSIEKGQVYGILGPNGSGKTTTLSILTGIIHPDSGNFQWFGKELSSDSLKRIGTLIETPNFYPYLSLFQNLKIITQIKSCPETDINRVLGLTNLLTRKHSKFITLSLGMKQRLGIAAALLGNPDVLVLDEPTNGLDPEGIAEIREIILKEASNGKTIILASHILDEVEKVCSHVAILKKGEIISSGSVQRLLSGEETIHIVTQKQEDFREALVREGMVKNIEKSGDELILSLNKGYSPGDLNEFAFKNGFVLEKIEVKKQNLETQFLELVK